MVFIAKHLQDSRPQKTTYYPTNKPKKNDNVVIDNKPVALPKKEFEAVETNMKNTSNDVENKTTKRQKGKKIKNNLIENKSDMNTSDKIALAKSILGKDTNKENFKILKSDKGLIERTESSKTILTEDNKELLID